ncbi:MAG: DUF6320 domain-containing protein [Clostridia bacterium]
MEPMKVRLSYPPNPKSSFWRRNRQALLRSGFLLAGYACLLVNLLGRGMPWSLIVIGGLMVFWVIFLYHPQVENTVIKKLCDSLIAVCLYLFLLDSVLGGGWSAYVVPIVFFGDLIVICGYFLLFFTKQKRNFLPLFELLLAGLVITLCTWVGFRFLDWPMIVVGSVSLGLLALCMALFWKPLGTELRKKFHV